MEVSSKFVLIAVLVLVSALAVAATKHPVGGTSGWEETTDFGSWASSEKFKVGDELDFKYSTTHSVVELPDESAYKSCDISSPVKSYSDGSDSIKLDKAGTRFFACGTPGHCSQGMKVKITTVAADGSSSSSSAPTTSSSPGATTTSTSASNSHQVRLLMSFLIASVVSVVVSVM